MRRDRTQSRSSIPASWSRLVLQRLAAAGRFQADWSEWIIAETWRVLTRRWLAEHGPDDEEALASFHHTARREGIVPALETAHAIAFARKLAVERGPGGLVLVNLSGRGDKDMDTYSRLL